MAILGRYSFFIEDSASPRLHVSQCSEKVLARGRGAEPPRANLLRVIGQRGRIRSSSPWNAPKAARRSWPPWALATAIYPCHQC